MNIIYTFSALTALTFIIIYTTKFDWKSIITNPYFSLIVIGIASRLFASSLNEGYDVDLNCFKAWSGMLAENGFGRFYSSPSFTDYPPGYMYVLFVIGWIRRIFGFSYDSAVFVMLIKAPAVICDLLTGILIYKMASKKSVSSNSVQIGSQRFVPYAWLISAAYILNPAIIINSSVWGQVDAVYTLVLIISFYWLSDKRYLIGFLSFAAAILIKPQSLFFSPIYIYVAFDIASSGGFKKENFIKVLKYALACLCFCLIFILPFVVRYENGIVFDIMPVISQYAATIGSYPYASLNAYNFFSLIGANWRSVDTSFFFMNYTIFGVLCIDAIVIISLYLLRKGKGERANYFFVAALINTLVFMFSTRMHERYLFPTLAFLLLAFIEKGGEFSSKKAFLLLYAFFSLTLFVNCADVINMLQNGNQAVYLENTLPPLSAANLILTIIMLVKAFTAFRPAKDHSAKTISQMPASVSDKRMNKRDYALMLGLSAVYAILAFYNLGDINAPQTVWNPAYMESVILDISNNPQSGAQMLQEIWFLNGVRNAQSFDIEFSETGDFDEPYIPNDLSATRITTDSVYSWYSQPIARMAKAIRITSLSSQLAIVELAFKTDGEIINLKPRDESAKLLVDEQNLVPERNTHMNSTIFDEIYHARSAYEYIHSMDVLEWSHPPLGKVIISWGIRIFGMTPFGWRFTGALFGVLMLPFMYMFGKRLFGSSGMAFFSALLIACDFMHYSQTRIATIDTYVTFFIIASFYFMFSYCDMKIDDSNFRKSILYLALSGAFIGCAAAAKWPGVYAAGGLAVAFFVRIYQRVRYEGFSVKRLVTTFAFCIVFFIAVPLIIYLLSYLPYMRTPGKSGISSVINNQLEMFRYHSGVNQPHPYQSSWWQWPLNIRPLAFVFTDVSPGIRSAISTFGNPLIWWSGICAAFYTLSAYSKKQNGTRDYNALFLLIAFAAQYLPWSLVPRTTYIYHYFPSVPFIILMTAYMFKDYFGAGNKNLKLGNISIQVNYYSIAFAVCVLAAFIVFFPVISGMPINYSFVHKFLRWLPSWQLM